MTQSAPWLEPFPRKFVDPGLTITAWSDIEPYYSRLAGQTVNSPEELEAWLSGWSELKGVVDEFAVRRYVDMTCHTDSEAKKEAYLFCVREIEPKLTEWEDKLNKLYLDSPHRAGLDKSGYGQFDRMVRVDIELFEEKNISIQVKLQESSQQYQELMGGMMVEFDGQERTMPQMSKYLREQDRDLRKSAYVATAERRLKEKDRLDEIFDSMLDLRAEFAANLNLDNYRDYCFKSKLRDYTPDDCFRFHEAIEKTAVPLSKKIAEKRRSEMGLDKLAPWDTECDAKGRPPLKPFEHVKDLSSGVEKIFMSIDTRLGERFGSIQDSMDLNSRKGKAPGGYQVTYSETRIPFIFTNAVGSQNDVNTLLHEGGHAFHTIESRGLPLIWYRHAAMEFSEVASMTQELLGGERLEPFYDNEEEQGRAREEHLKGVVGIFGWVAQVDAFQHWIYTNPGHSRDQRGQAWLDLSERFLTDMDWSQAPKDTRKYLWHRQLHIFELPFYYVEYAIAQLGALQIYRNYKKDPKKAVDDYLGALAIGGARPAPELFEAAGAKFDFSTGLLGELMELIEEELGL